MDDDQRAAFNRKTGRQIRRAYGALCILTAIIALCYAINPVLVKHLADRFIYSLTGQLP
jgi:hypothetical protein